MMSFDINWRKFYCQFCRQLSHHFDTNFAVMWHHVLTSMALSLWPGALRRGRVQYDQAHIARGIHGLPKVSPRPTMADPSTPYGQATPETALWLFWGWPTRRTVSLQQSFTPLPKTSKGSSWCVGLSRRQHGNLWWRRANNWVTSPTFSWHPLKDMKFTCDRLNWKEWPHPRALRPLDGA